MANFCLSSLPNRLDFQAQAQGDTSQRVIAVQHDVLRVNLGHCVDFVFGCVLAGSGEGFAQSMGEAARRLEDEGVRAITGNCGFMAAYQSYVAEQVSIPVFLSSLLQIPMLTSMLGPSRTLGVITANGAGMTPELLSAIGIDDHSRFVIQGLENSEHFNSAILQETGELDDERIREEVVQACLDLLAREPSVAAFLLECSDLPPYSKDIHAATGLPVFDWANYIRYVYGAVVPRNYSGFA